MNIAKDVSSRSTCLRRHVGCVFVNNKQILSTGYNGSPTGMEHCIDTGKCIRESMNIPSGERHELCMAVHAEQNAIIQAAVHGVKLENVTRYVTCHPCSICAKMMVNANVKRIVFGGSYNDELASNIFKKAGVETYEYKE